MDAGSVAEIAPPSVLLGDPASAFSRLVDRTGAASAAALRQMAADFFQVRPPLFLGGGGTQHQGGHSRQPREVIANG